MSTPLIFPQCEIINVFNFRVNLTAANYDLQVMEKMIIPSK